MRNNEVFIWGGGDGRRLPPEPDYVKTNIYIPRDPISDEISLRTEIPIMEIPTLLSRMVIAAQLSEKKPFWLDENGRGLGGTWVSFGG